MSYYEDTAATTKLTWWRIFSTTVFRKYKCERERQFLRLDTPGTDFNRLRYVDKSEDYVALTINYYCKHISCNVADRLNILIHSGFCLRIN
jgi:hypothetical protein